VSAVLRAAESVAGQHFRLLLVGYFEGLDSERGIAWRAADSLAVRSFVGLGLDAATPDHSTLSRTRRLIALRITNFSILRRRGGAVAPFVAPVP